MYRVSGDIFSCDNVSHTVGENFQPYSPLPIIPCVSPQCGAGTVIGKKHLTDSLDNLEVLVLFPLGKQRESIR